jgi:uncharacterized protein
MLGIMLVNFPTMNTRAGEETSQYGGVHGALDRAAGVANMALCNGKFYPIFALLFGWSLAVLGRSREQGGGRPDAVLRRRLLVLLGFGLAHVVLVWWGDILAVYALLGLLVLPCLRWSARALLGGALALLLFAQLLSPLLAVLEHLGIPASGAVLVPGLGLHLPSSELVAQVYGQGRFAEMLRQRGLDYLSDFTPLAARQVTLGAAVGYAGYYGQLAGLFLLGMWAARKDLAARLAAPGRWTWAVWWPAALAAAALTALRYSVPALEESLYAVQGEALALLYLISFALLYPHLGPVVRPLQAVGRMSLTAYLAHTALASLLLYGTGLGLYGRIGPAILLPVSIGCYLLLAVACALWLRRFGTGPAEWAWRALYQGRREGSPAPLAR